MKTIKILVFALFASVMFISCTRETYIENNYTPNTNSISLPQLMEGNYELWYVDYDLTTGTGDVPFLTRAFTVSFVNGNLFANNNLAGIGTTGNGYGIRIGSYDYFTKAIRVYHNIYGTYDLEVYQTAPNKIKIYSASQNVTYFLTGYQRSSFDYNKLFNDNIRYFLQEYKAWEKVYTSRWGALNDFDRENFVQFLAGGSSNRFRSSRDLPGTPFGNLYWDFTGNYGIFNTSNPYTKTLTLNYNFWGNEYFTLSVINDHRIRLFHNASGTTYEFEGRGFIQYMKQSPQEVKKTAPVEELGRSKS